MTARNGDRGDAAQPLGGSAPARAHDAPASGLDDLVVWVANRLMPARHDTVSEAIADVLAALQRFFAVDTVFLRRNDFERGLSVLIDEWPRREQVPDPDPLGEVPFDADPIWQAARSLREPFVMRPQDADEEYQRRVEQASGVGDVSLAVVPLHEGEETVGVLGLIMFGDRPWTDDEVGALSAIASLLAQARARTNAEQQLDHLARFDALTGLANRRLLLPEVERRRADPRSESFALVFMDLDNHKHVNDLLGNRAGDEVLVTVAKRLEQLVRGSDLVARLGDDEFVVVLDGITDEDRAKRSAERVLAEATASVTVADHTFRPTASAGIALSSSADSVDGLLANADVALHQAKAEGRDRAVVFDELLRSNEVARRDLQLMLRAAIDEQQLELHYQPEVDLATGEVLGVEALVRWNHPHRGLLTAGAFIEVAERSGMIVDLGRWAVAEASRQDAEWRARMPHLATETRVNLSPLQLRGGDVLHTLAVCQTHGDVRGRLSLEITEHAVLQDVEQAIRVLHELRALGVTVAIDDFGTGQSSLSQLKRLPLDFLKIDRSFVRDLGRDPADRALVDAMADLARAFDLELIGEGIETQRHVDQLLEVGCRRGQGFLFAKPMPAWEMELLLWHDERLLPVRSGWSAS